MLNLEVIVDNWLAKLFGCQHINASEFQINISLSPTVDKWRVL